MIIFLIGYMGSGKSTVGKKLSNAVGVEFLDIDTLFEKQENMSISEYFNLYGEEEFRKKESKLLRSFDINRAMIISTGGGTPCYFNNIKWMNDNGHTIYLKMPPKALYSRLIHSRQTRPLLDHRPDPENFITKHLQERERYYLQSKEIVNGLSIDISALAKRVLTLLS